jgi:hypothetical protein
MHVSIEPSYPEDEKSLEIIEKTAKAWNKSQLRLATPRGTAATGCSGSSNIDENN